MAHRGPVVFLFVGMTCRIFEDKLTLQGSTLCKWYANPELPETAALQDRAIGTLPMQRSSMWFLINHGGIGLVRSAIKQCIHMETNINALSLHVLEQQEDLDIVSLLSPLILCHQQSSKVKELYNLCSLDP